MVKSIKAKISALAMSALATLILYAAWPAHGNVPSLSCGRQDSPVLDDVDAFMQKVLEKRKINWDQLYDYVFGELEILEFGGSIEIPALQSFRRDYSWFVKDGYLVRSPVSVNGAPVPEAERLKAEENGIKGSKKNKEQFGSIDRDSFFRFKFEPGNYVFAGRKVFKGREVAVVEYYPRRFFSDGEGKDEDDKYENMLDKTSLVTMLIDPSEYQIVHVTFDNVGMEFLPGRWLVRVDKMFASMEMEKPFNEVWLPNEIMAAAKVTTANGTMSVEYKRIFRDYKKTDVKVLFRFGERPEAKDEK
jgi:hypothetical protein